jgi:hypothetical protein
VELRLADFVEEEARRETWSAWRSRHRGRLFPLPDIDARHERSWWTLDELYWGKAVGIVPPLDGGDPGHEIVVCGIWHGIGPGFLGTDLKVTHFFSYGTSTHRSPLNIGFVHLLPRRFQRVAEIMQRERDDY